MARKRRTPRIRYRTIKVPKRSRRKGFSGLRAGFLASLIGVPVISWLLAKLGVIPASWFLPTTLIATGAAVYAVDGHQAGMAVVGAGLGVALAEYLAGAGASQPSAGTVWI